MATVPAEVQGPSDAELIDAVRKGTLEAYGSLYERHVGAAYNLARQLSRSKAEADDLVAEAFAKVMETLKAGRGPDSAFRAYLLTALRHTAYDKTRRDRKVELSEDVSQVSGVSAEAVSVPFTDPAVAGLERSLAARAFARLPERWQAVLWHTEIEGQSPAEVAPILGLTPNGVSALAYRAREGLKQAYLQVHLADTAETEQRCRATADRLGAWTRDGLSKREKAQVEAHLDECKRCQALAAELADVNGALRIFVAPLVLGSGTLGYLATAGAAAKAAVAGGAVLVGAAAGGAAVTSASGGGAAGGAASSVPRQVLGVAAAGAALAAAVALALTAGGGKQDIPQAAPAPQPPPATANPPSPNQPPPPGNTPSNTPSQPSQSPTQPPPLGPPNLTATPPGVPISLIAGGGPVDLPLTVRNDGASLSGPVQATLNLPAGVTAIPSGPSRFAAAPLLTLNAAPASSTVFCPGGTKTVTCGTKAGLQPGESVTLLFRLIAAENSPGGEVTGSVSDGRSVSVRVTVRVEVKPPPAVDGVDVKAKAERFDTLLPGLLSKQLVHITATNTGTSTKPMTITVDRGGLRLSSSPKLNCTTHDHSTTCTTVDPVPPGGVVKLTVRLHSGLLGLGCPHGVITVTATLGSAKDTETVKVQCWTLPVLPGLLPNTITPSPPAPPEVPPRPPVKPHLQPPVVKPSSPPNPLPNVVVPQPPAPTAPPPPQDRSILPPLLGWLLPG